MELYEFAKQIDVIAVFTLIYGIGLGGLMYGILELGHRCIDKVKKHRAKKKDTTEE